MKDDKIVNLFWSRDEDAIKQTSMKYGAYCYMIGEFVTSGGLIDGGWEITFPIYPSINNPDGTASQINAIRGSE